MKVKVLGYLFLVIFVAACSNPFFPPLKPKGVTLSISNTGAEVDIGSVIVGETPDPFEVTITNNGDNPTGDITITLSGDDADKFTIVPDTLDSIDPGDSDSFKIIPDDGLPEGEYKATVTIDCEDGTKIEFDIIFVVNPAPCTFAVIFDSNGGSAVASITGVTSGATITAPAPPTKGSYGAFGGWFKDVALNNEWNFSSDVVAEDITLYAKWNAAYAIGGTGPAGGIIFYVDPNGFTVQDFTGVIGSFAAYTAYYLEVAPSNEVGPEFNGQARWSAYGTLISGVTTFTSSGAAEASVIGNGRKDTFILFIYIEKMAGEGGRAASLCFFKSLNGFNDWFLPSSGELNQLYINRAAVNSAGGSLGTSSFWSSSQYGSYTAWTQNFSSGDRGNLVKNSTATVRAVRAF